MKKNLAIVFAALCLFVAQAETFQIGLNSTDDTGGLLAGGFVVPATSSTATGGEVGIGISYDNSTGMMDFNVAYGLFGFQPLQGNFQTVQIYQGAAGANGSSVLNLASYHTAIGPNAGFISGSFPISIALDQALFTDSLYVQITSSAFPGGEIRAQLIPTTVPEPSTWALAGMGIAALIILRHRH